MRSGSCRFYSTAETGRQPGSVAQATASPTTTATTTTTATSGTTPPPTDTTTTADGSTQPPPKKSKWKQRLLIFSVVTGGLYALYRNAQPEYAENRETAKRYAHLYGKWQVGTPMPRLKYSDIKIGPTADLTFTVPLIRHDAHDMRDNALLSEEFMDNLRKALVSGVGMEAWLESPLLALQTSIARSLLGLNANAKTSVLTRANGEKQLLVQSGSSTKVNTYLQILPVTSTATTTATSTPIGTTVAPRGVPGNVGQKLTPLESEAAHEKADNVITTNIRLVVIANGTVRNAHIHNIHTNTDAESASATGSSIVNGDGSEGPSTLGYFLLPLVARGLLLTVVKDAIQRESIWHAPSL